MIKYDVSCNTKMRKEWLKTYQITCFRSTFSPLPPWQPPVLIRDQTLSSVIYSSLFEFRLFFLFLFFSKIRRYDGAPDQIQTDLT